MTTRDDAIIELAPWLQTPPGRYLLQWEQARTGPGGGRSVRLSCAAARLAGTRRAARQPHAAPLGRARFDAGARARGAAGAGRRHQHAVAERAGARCTAISMRCRSRARASTCWCCRTRWSWRAIRTETLREVERVLVPEGRVVIVGFNPASLWGLRQRLGAVRQRLGLSSRRAVPAARRRVHRLLAAARLAAPAELRSRARALRLLAAAAALAALARPLRAGSKRTGDRWWPVFGAVYFVVAVKRVRGMRLVGLRAEREGSSPRRRRRWWRNLAIAEARPSHEHRLHETLPLRRS